MSAELELKKLSVFSSNKEARFGMGIKTLKGTANASIDLSQEQDESYSVYVEFNEPV